MYENKEQTITFGREKITYEKIR